MDDNRRWGTDLRLLPDLEHASDRDGGHDLATTVRPQSRACDLATCAGSDNLRQALLLRLLTPAGDLAALGHPDYGSQLFRLIGERNIDATRNRAKLYVLQALAAEPRVAEVMDVQVVQNSRDRTRMDISVSLKAIRSDNLLNLVFPFFLGGVP